MIPFVSNAEFFLRYDGRWVGKNILDDGTAATIAEMTAVASIDPVTGDITYNNLSGQRVKVLAQDASEELMSAAAVGARYTEEQLREYGGNLLLSIVSGLMLGPILQRRGRAVDDFESLSASYTLARTRVEELRRGERIFFNVPDVPEAGLPTTATTDPVCGVNPPLLTQQAVRYFGTPVGGPTPRY